MSNAKVYIWSDTHIGHTNILKFEPMRSHYKDIDEHDRDLVARCNSVVRGRDTLWFLGDVFFGSPERALKILDSMNGYKKLVMGNHDRNFNALAQVFDQIYGAAEYGNCIMTHIPVHPYQLEKRYLKNIHGHMHSKKLDNSKYVCVSVEQTDFKPVLLSRLVQ